MSNCGRRIEWDGRTDVSTDLTARIAEILLTSVSGSGGTPLYLGINGHRLGDKGFAHIHYASLIAEAAEQHYRPRVEELGRAIGVLSDTVHELQGRQPGLTQPAADPRTFGGPDHHDFLPVRGHPDDDECTHRADGTDATYCGMSRARHEWWSPGAGE